MWQPDKRVFILFLQLSTRVLMISVENTDNVDNMQSTDNIDNIDNMVNTDIDNMESTDNIDNIDIDHLFDNKEINEIIKYMKINEIFENTDVSENTDNTEINENTDNTDISENTEVNGDSDSTDISKNTDRTDINEITDNTDISENTDNTEINENIVNIEINENIDNMEINENTDNTDNIDINDITDNTEINENIVNIEINENIDNIDINENIDNIDINENTDINDITDNTDINDITDNTEINEITDNMEINENIDNTDISENTDNTETNEITENTEVNEITDDEFEIMYSQNYFGDKFFYEDVQEDCPFLRKTSVVRDMPVVSDGSEHDMAELSLPPGFELRHFGEKWSVGVWTTHFFPSGTRFGPLIGAERLEKMNVREDEFEFRHRVNNEHKFLSNWLRYVTWSPTVADSNLVRRSDDTKIYYYAVRDIQPGEQLKLWAGSLFAESIGQPGSCRNIKHDESCWPFFYHCEKGSCLIDSCSLEEGVVLEHLEMEEEMKVKEDEKATGYSSFTDIFEPLYVVRNIKLPMDGSVKDRAMRTVPPYITIKQSNIKGAGLGAFAAHDIPSRMRFGPYEGLKIVDVVNSGEKGYAWRIYYEGEKYFYWDAKDLPHSNWIRYINTANYFKDQNMDTVQIRENIYYYSVRPIPKGTELLTWYGHSYDEALGITTRHKDDCWNDLLMETAWPFFFVCAKGNCANQLTCPIEE